MLLPVFNVTLFESIKSNPHENYYESKARLYPLKISAFCKQCHSMVFNFAGSVWNFKTGFQGK